MPGGRPTKLTPELLEKAEGYAKGEWKDKYDHAFPSVVGLCKEIRINKSTAYDWAKDPETEYQQAFSDILDEISNNAEFRLIDGSLKNELNSNISKLVLGKYGYSEKHQQEIVQPEGVTFNMNFGAKE